MNPSFPSVSLYVGDLASDVTEGHLFEIFNAIGPVALIRVCRDASSRRKSLGYAYVNFYNHSDAERALNTLNCTPIKGRPCRIMWSQRDSAERNSGVGNIFVKNLDRNFDQKALNDLFSPFGTILSSKIALDDSNVSKGYGFVQFSTDEEAAKAIQALNGSTVQGKEIFVGPFIPRKERQPNEENFTNLFVKNLDENVDTQRLEEVFRAFGELTSVTVMTEADGKSKCFGFVNFAEHKDALAALEALNNTVLNEGGKVIFVGKAQKRSERDAELRYKYDKHRRPSYTHNNNYLVHNSHVNNTPATSNIENRFNVYLKNLDAKVDEQRIKDEFSRFGTILSVKLVRDDKGNSRGFGFVSFKTPDEANKAINEMRGKPIEGKNIYVAHRKDNRGRENQNQRQKGGNRWNQNQNQNQSQNSNQNSKQPRRNNSSANANSSGNNSKQGNNAQGQTKSNTSRANSSSSSSSSSSPTNNTQEVKTQQPTPSAQPAPTSSNPIEELLSQIPPEHQLPAVAERLYPLIAQSQGAELAGKITGMLMDRYSNPHDLAAFLFDENSLKEKVDEAAKILNQASQQQAPQQ